MAVMAQGNLLRTHCLEAIFSIHAECAEILSAENNDDNGASSAGTKTSLAGCGPALVSLLSRQADILRGQYQNGTKTITAVPLSTAEQKPSEVGEYDLALKRLEDIASIAYSKFYAYLFKDLPVSWRQLYTDARILKFCLLFLSSPYAAAPDGDASFDDTVRDDGLDELIKTLDLALLLAGAAGEVRGRKWIDKALELLRLLWLAESQGRDSTVCSTASHDRPAKRAKLTEGHGASEAHGAHSTHATFSTNEPFTPPVTRPIKAVEALSMEEFQTYMDRPRDPKLGPEPLVLRNALGEWPALSTRPWNRPSYLLSQTFDGRRLVPVEVGRSYVDEGWGQKLITFGAFLRGYIDPTATLRPSSSSSSPPPKNSSNVVETAGSGDRVDNSNKDTPPKPIAYLAQHQLFTQLPSLRNDVLIPDYCYTSPPLHPCNPAIDQPELDSPLLNAWFGPPGTISPLHTDPYHNILAQVVGRKYVRLYAPRETPRLAARGRENGVEMGNTSALDVGVLEGWDRAPTTGEGGESGDEKEGGGEGEGENETGREIRKDQIIAFKAVPFVDCILGPGDALYIPIGWWHYVRGLSVSFSVSFWWN